MFIDKRAHTTVYHQINFKNHEYNHYYTSGTDVIDQERSILRIKIVDMDNDF